MRIAAFLAACLLAGCATAPPPLDPAAASRPIAKGSARVLVTRSTDMQYGAIPAEIEIGGAPVAKLWRGEVYAGDVPAGSTEVAVNVGSKVYFDAAAGKTYRFAVSDNSGRGLATGLGGLIGGAAYEAGSGASGFFRIEATAP